MRPKRGFAIHIATEQAARSPSSQVEHHRETTPDGSALAGSAVHWAGRSRWRRLQTRRRKELDVADDCGATGQRHLPSLPEFLGRAGQPKTDDAALGRVPAIVGDNGEHLLLPADWQGFEVDASEAWVPTRGRSPGLWGHFPVDEVSDVEHRDKGGGDRRRLPVERRPRTVLNRVWLTVIERVQSATPISPTGGRRAFALSEALRGTTIGDLAHSFHAPSETTTAPVVAPSRVSTTECHRYTEAG